MKNIMPDRPDRRRSDGDPNARPCHCPVIAADSLNNQRYADTKRNTAKYKINGGGVFVFFRFPFQYFVLSVDIKCVILCVRHSVNGDVYVILSVRQTPFQGYN